jgi:hypothetical protein
MKLDEIRKRIKLMNLSKLARESGLKHWHIRHVFKGKNPNYWHVEKLSDYIEKGEVKE